MTFPRLTLTSNCLVAPVLTSRNASRVDNRSERHQPSNTFVTVTTMRLTIACEWNETVVAVEVSAEASLDDLKAAIACELNDAADTASLVVRKDGKALQTPGATSAGASSVASTLGALGVVDGDLLTVGRANANANASSSARATRPDGTAVDPVGMMRELRASSQLMTQLRTRDAAMASAIEREDVEAFQNRMREFQKRTDDLRRAEAEEMALMHADPFDVEAQKKIEEAMRRENVQHNLEMAMDETPEVFGQVVMLYVDAEVNGTPLKAFVDSGAQMTIMSVGFARKCGLERLIDHRFQGMAKGVGTQKIIGRVHQAPMKLSGHFVPTAITVLEQEQEMDFILGLDMLRRHQCCIDLKRNVLMIGSVGAELPFLGEGDIGKQPFFDEKAPAEAAPAEAAPPAPSTAPSAPSSSNVDESKVEQLMSLGFTRAQVIEALQATGGNQELAGALLFGG